MKRLLLITAGCLALGTLGGCAELSTALNAFSPGSTSTSSVVTTVTLDATHGLYAAETVADVATAAAQKAADVGLLHGASAQKALDLVQKVHGYIAAAHAGVTLGNSAAIASNAQAAINSAADLAAITPPTQ